MAAPYKELEDAFKECINNDNLFECLKTNDKYKKIYNTIFKGKKIYKTKINPLKIEFKHNLETKSIDKDDLIYKSILYLLLINEDKYIYRKQVNKILKTMNLEENTDLIQKINAALTIIDNKVRFKQGSPQGKGIPQGIPQGKGNPQETGSPQGKSISSKAQQDQQAQQAQQAQQKKEIEELLEWETELKNINKGQNPLYSKESIIFEFLKKIFEAYNGTDNDQGNKKIVAQLDEKQKLLIQEFNKLIENIDEFIKIFPEKKPSYNLGPFINTSGEVYKIITNINENINKINDLIKDNNINIVPKFGKIYFIFYNLIVFKISNKKKYDEIVPHFNKGKHVFYTYANNFKDELKIIYSFRAIIKKYINNGKLDIINP